MHYCFLSSQFPSEVLSHQAGKWLIWDLSPDVFTLKPFSHAIHRQCERSALSQTIV